MSFLTGTAEVQFLVLWRAEKLLMALRPGLDGQILD